MLVHTRYGIVVSFCQRVGISVVNTESPCSVFLRCKYAWCCPFSLRVFYAFFFNNFESLDFLNFSRLWSCTMQCPMDGLDNVMEDFNTLFCEVYMTKMAVPHLLKFGQYIYEFVTMLWLLLGWINFFFSVLHILWEAFFRAVWCEIWEARNFAALECTADTSSWRNVCWITMPSWVLSLELNLMLVLTSGVV